MKCEHDNCLTCPYPDCISEKGPINTPRKKPGRKKIDPEVKKQNARRYQRQYYEEHTEECNAASRKYYKENTEKCREYQRNYRNRIRGTLGKPLFNIWITDGIKNKRIKEEQYLEYEKLGWKRGRTLNPYIKRGIKE